MNEIYKTVPSNTNYEVSNLGNVRRLAYDMIDKNGRKVSYKAKQMTLTKTQTGYHTVSVKLPEKSSPNALVHILMREAFSMDMDHNKCVDHIDHNGQNNRLDNLRVVSQRVNTQNRYDKKNPGASYNKISKSYVSQIRYNNELYFLGYAASAEEASALYMKACDNLEIGILPVKKGPRVKKESK